MKIKKLAKKDLIQKALEEFGESFCVEQIVYVKDKKTFRKKVLRGGSYYMAENIIHFISEHLSQIYELAYEEGKKSRTK